MNKLIIPLILSIPALVMAAGEKIDQTKATGATPKVKLENVRGKITVKGWDKNEVKVVGNLDELTDRFIFDTNHDQIKIIIDAPHQGGNWGQNNSQSTDLTIHLPTKASLDAEGS